MKDYNEDVKETNTEEFHINEDDYEDMTIKDKILQGIKEFIGDITPTKIVILFIAICAIIGIIQYSNPETFLSYEDSHPDKVFDLDSGNYVDNNTRIIFGPAGEGLFEDAEE